VSSYGLEVLGADECAAHLREQRVGRVALAGDEPAVLPVVYAMVDGDVVFRTAPGAKLVAAVLHRTVVFEIDDYDVVAGHGWSVNLVGPATEIVHPAELSRVRALELPCWAGEARDRYVRITATHVSGRRIVGPN
jgi:nitroimidazol reductase NimA-like FMN-containing flavoprotein (pyridoxamine 5'-phosphate oxidase superfamily)